MNSQKCKQMALANEQIKIFDEKELQVWLNFKVTGSLEGSMASC